MKKNKTSDKRRHGRNHKRMHGAAGPGRKTLVIELGNLPDPGMLLRPEEKKAIEEALFEQVAAALQEAPEAVKNPEQKAMTVNIQHNYEGAIRDAATISVLQDRPCISHAIDKWQEAFAENRKLAAENRALYERLLQNEQEKNDLTQQLAEVNHKDD